jgi:hypothetical protein
LFFSAPYLSYSAQAPFSEHRHGHGPPRTADDTDDAVFRAAAADDVAVVVVGARPGIFCHGCPDDADADDYDYDYDGDGDGGSSAGGVGSGCRGRGRPKKDAS